VKSAAPLFNSLREIGTKQEKQRWINGSLHFQGKTAARRHDEDAVERIKVISRISTKSAVSAEWGVS